MRTLASFAICLLLPAVLQATTPRQASTLHPAFVENVGQARYMDGAPASHVDAVLSRGKATAYIHETGLHVVHAATQMEDGELVKGLYRVDIDLIGANPSARHEWADPDPGIDRYLLTGTGPNGVQARRYRIITYRDVYPGIDLRITITDRGPKMDYIVHPGADPSRIAVAYRGATSLMISDDGSLSAVTPVTTMRENAPVAWTQTMDGSGKQLVPVSFRLDGTSIRFRIAEYDRSRTLVIDPELVWATYYGGNGYFTAPMVAMDGVGNIYTAGETITRDLPTSAGVFQRRFTQRQEGYVAKFTWDGQHVWSTYVGSKGTDYVYDLEIDGNGDVEKPKQSPA